MVKVDDVATDQIGAHRPAIRQHHRQAVRTLDHVAVREDEPVGREGLRIRVEQRTVVGFRSVR